LKDMALTEDWQTLGGLLAATAALVWLCRATGRRRGLPPGMGLPGLLAAWLRRQTLVGSAETARHEESEVWFVRRLPEGWRLEVVLWRAVLVAVYAVVVLGVLGG
jgi:hypothetical protein